MIKDVEKRVLQLLLIQLNNVTLLVYALTSDSMNGIILMTIRIF